MKQKLYYLLALTFLLLFGTGKNVVHAATETIFSAVAKAEYSVPANSTDTEITSTYATVTGGTMYVTNGQSNNVNLIASNSNKLRFCFTNNNTFFKVVLNQSLQEGDVISVNYLGGLKNSDNKGVWISTASSRPSSAPAAAITSSTESYIDGTYTVTSNDEYVGKTTFYLYRAAGATTYMSSITITREVASAPVFSTNLPATSTVGTGSTKTFTVASGNATYQWYKANSPTAAPATDTAIDGATSASYNYTAPNTEGIEYIYCVATNANGSTTSNVCTVTVASTLTVTFATANIHNAGTGTVEPSTHVSSASVGLSGNNISFGSSQSYSTVTYSEVSYTGSSSTEDEKVMFTICPKKGVTFTPTRVSFGAIRFATDGGTMTVKANNQTLASNVVPGRNKSGKEQDGYVFAYPISDVTATKDSPLTISIAMVGLNNKKWGIADLVVEGTYTGTPEDGESYTVSSSVNIDGAGTVSQSPAGTSIEEETTVTFTATANAGYAFVNWTDDNNQDAVLGTNATYTINSLDANIAITANFKKLYKVTYDLGEYAGTLTGKVLCNYIPDKDINEIYAGVNDGYTIPTYAHRYLYREGYFLSGWTDGTNTYSTGQNITLTGDITLTPTWTATTQTLATSDAETTVTWSFAKSNIVFVDWQSNDTYGYYTKPHTINEELIAVPMQITKGKVSNYGRTDAIAQTNQNTTLTIPAVKGMKVTIANAYVDFSTTTIAGSTAYSGSGTKTIEYTYNGTDETIDIVIGEDNQYLNTIAVTYPKIEKGSPSDLAITTPANGEWSVDLDDPSADKTQQIAYSSSSEGVVTYSTSNASIATVSETGLITAKSNGTATITVSQAATETYQAGTAQIAVTVTGGVTIIGTDEVSLVFTTSGYDSNTKTWTNGTYTLVGSNGVDGNNGQCFKLKNSTYTLKVPANIRVDKIEYTGYDYNNSVTEGEISTATVTVDGATTMSGWKAYYANYNSAQNTTIAREISHNTGEDITLAVTGAGQIIGTMKLYVSEIELTTAPTLVSQSNTTTHNGHVVLNFSQPMAGATATIDGQSVTAEGGSSALTFYYWGLDYGKQVTFTLPANGLEDEYGNAYEGEDITINFTIDAKPTLTKKKFDVIVGTEGNEDLQTVLDSYKNYSGSERKYIFIPDGTYKLTGNSSFTTSGDQTGYVYDETTGEVSAATVYPAGTYTDNAMTQLRSSNLSIIGQSKDKTILYNIPYIPGISYTSTLEFRNGSDNYLQDFTLKNMYAGGANDKGVAVAFYDRGTRTIAKNISCWSNQDTYVSNGARDYYETSTFAGTVDFICGNGDVWFQQCDLIINNRSGNVITAPRTAATEKWGYVFYENTISRAEGATLVTDKSWNLGRPWNDSPAATFLYTTMNTLPKDAGWTNMTNGKVLRFHEYGSKNAGGSPLDLSNRSTAACNGDAASDDPVLTAEQAAKYTIHNVLGGTDGWDPTEYTAQVSVTGLALNGYTLTWDDNEDALCWMVFKDGVYFDNVITNSVTADGAGEYTVRAANARGGLGEGMTVTVSTEAITTNTFGNASHVAGKALDFSGVEGLKAYVATAADGAGITLAEVTAVPAGTAFVVQATEKTEQTYYIPTTTENVTLTVQNVFEGSATKSTATQGDYTYYALSKSKGMFAKVGSSVASIPAGKAFVKISNNVNAKETLMFFFDGEATGIVDVDAAEAKQNGVRKQFINGQLIIIKGDKQYNAAGGEF